jgi:peptidoglycan/xylan/chitin deacetylase (PgdA/CDA1 family)
LNQHQIKASFFFTGDFYRNPEFKDMIVNLKNDGHYLGAHSDKHLLYASWEKRDSILLSRSAFIRDLKNNYLEMEKYNIQKDEARFYLPPYEWYNDTIATWTEELGLQLVNFTAGTSSNQDWTYPELGASYISSKQIVENIMQKADSAPSGLNGHNLLIHFGTDPRREDKLYTHLNKLIAQLKEKGYQFSRIDETAY